jgi:hypothetical protein
VGGRVKATVLYGKFQKSTTASCVLIGGVLLAGLMLYAEPKAIVVYGRIRRRRRNGSRNLTTCTRGSPLVGAGVRRWQRFIVGEEITEADVMMEFGTTLFPEREQVPGRSDSNTSKLGSLDATRWRLTRRQQRRPIISRIIQYICIVPGLDEAFRWIKAYWRIA